MATAEDIARVRRMTGEIEPDSTYTDETLGALIDEINDLNIVASRVWGEKASMVADLVNITEAGSSRSNSDLFKHAKDQQAYYSGLTGDGSTAISSTTRRIERV